MAPIRRVVLDVLKPHDPPLQIFAKRVAERESVDGVTATLVEIDREVQNITLAVEGTDLDIDAIESTVTDLGGSVHSVDQVSCGKIVSAHGTSTDIAKQGLE